MISAMTRDLSPLRVLICDDDDWPDEALRLQLECSEAVATISAARTIKEAQRILPDFNVVFIDPLRLGLEPASDFILRSSDHRPRDLVFVLFVDPSIQEFHHASFYSGERHRFWHYNYLSKRIDLTAWPDEVTRMLALCLANREPRRHVGEDTVFVSYQRGHDADFRGLRTELTAAGLNVISARDTTGSVSQGILNAIRTSQCAVFLLHRYKELNPPGGGRFTANPSLLEEKGAALVWGIPVVLMVEHGVVDEIGRLAGDKPLYRFSDNTFLSQVMQVVEVVRDLTTKSKTRPIPSMRDTVKTDQVFLSYSFHDTDLVDGLRTVLEGAGLTIVTGENVPDLIGQEILQRIRTSDAFVSVLTKRRRYADETYGASPWLHEETGAALALRRRRVLMVENVVIDRIHLAGDWRLLSFARGGRFVSAAHDALDELKLQAGKRVR